MLLLAAALDEERASGTIRSPLHGIPMLIKNNIATKDKLNNTAGSHLLLGATVPRDATVVPKLRAAGVIILGKSNLSQWAYFRSSNSSSGWSAHGGQVLGAYHTKQDPCGSSSGSGVGSSIGLAWASLGSETDGSIVCPAERNNIVGIKPTVGLTSRSLVIPISEHQDTIGPMARTVSDAAHILSVISGKDELDNYTLAQPWDVPPNYALALNISSLKGARIGVPRNALLAGNISQPVMDAFEVAVQVLKDAGATVIENANLDAWEEFEADYRNPFGNHSMILHVDFFFNLPGYLSQLTSNPYKIEGLAGLRELTQNSPSEAYPQRNTAIWDKSLAYGLNNSDIRFWQAYQHVSYFGGEGGVPGALARHSLDALILPSDLSSGIAAGAGLPLISSPMGFYPGRSPVTKSKFWGLVESGPGIPFVVPTCIFSNILTCDRFGLSFTGGKWSEEKLIGLAYAFEQRTNFRKKKPLFLPKTRLRDVVKT